MAGVETTGAGCVKTYARPVKVVEIAQSVGKHGCSSAGSKVTLLYLGLLEHDSFIFTSKTADEDTSVCSENFVHWTSRYDRIRPRFLLV